MGWDESYLPSRKNLSRSARLQLLPPVRIVFIALVRQKFF